MKKILLAVALTLCAWLSHALDVRLGITANPAADEVSGYNIFHAHGTNDFLLVGFTTNTAYTVANVLPGTNRFRISAKNIWGDSDLSDPVTLTPAGLPTLPKKPTITVVVLP